MHFPIGKAYFSRYMLVSGRVCKTDVFWSLINIKKSVGPFQQMEQMGIADADHPSASRHDLGHVSKFRTQQKSLKKLKSQKNRHGFWRHGVCPIHWCEIESLTIPFPFSQRTWCQKLLFWAQVNKRKLPGKGKRTDDGGIHIELGWSPVKVVFRWKL